MKIVAYAIPDLENSSYEFFAPDLPGCTCKSASYSKGMVLFKSIVNEHLILLCEYGESIPPLNDIDHHIKQKYSVEMIWFVVELDESAFLGKSHKINVTLPEMLIKKIDDRVSKSEDYKSRSAFLAKAAIEELNRVN